MVHHPGNSTFESFLRDITGAISVIENNSYIQFHNIKQNIEYVPFSQENNVCASYSNPSLANATGNLFNRRNRALTRSNNEVTINKLKLILL